MMGYVQQFHDEAGDAVDRSMWVDLTRRSDAALRTALSARILVASLSAAAVVLGCVGVALLPWSGAGHHVPATSPLALPSMALVFAGILFLALSLGGLWRVLHERALRRFARRVVDDPKPDVHLGVVRSHS